MSSYNLNDPDVIIQDLRKLDPNLNQTVCLENPYYTNSNEIKDHLFNCDVEQIVQELQFVQDGSSSIPEINTNHKAKKQKTSRTTSKPKKYELPNMEDPEEERRRKNAVTAKFHRDNKKSELENLKGTVQERDNTISLLRTDLERANARVSLLEQDVQHKQTLLDSVHQLVKNCGNICNK